MDDQLKKLLAGTLEIPLNGCTLRQRGSEAPVIYAGPALITQDGTKNLRLQLFAEGHDFSEALRREFGRSLTPGKLVPETEFFDFNGQDLRGDLWSAEKIRASCSFGSSGAVHIESKLRDVELNSDRPDSAQGSSASAFFPGRIDLPWHLTSNLPNGGVAVDRLEQTTETCTWIARKQDQGIELRVSAHDGLAEEYFTHAWRALCIATGRRLEPVRMTVATGSSARLRLIGGAKDDRVRSNLLPPVQMNRPHSANFHAFLSAFVAHASKQDSDGKQATKLIYQHWHRIQSAHAHDIENSALALAVAIEGITTDVFASENDVNQAFLAEIELAKPIVKKATLGSRARGCLLSSLGNASRPRVQDVLRRLIEQGALTDRHLESWKELRHTSAHGSLLEDDPAELQRHLDHLYICLDLFYRLLFIVIGFRGKHRDLSVAEWPEAHFPPGAT